MSSRLFFTPRKITVLWLTMEIIENGCEMHGFKLKSSERHKNFQHCTACGYTSLCVYLHTLWLYRDQQPATERKEGESWPSNWCLGESGGLVGYPPTSGGKDENVWDEWLFFEWLLRLFAFIILMNSLPITLMMSNVYSKALYTILNNT